MPRNRRIDYPNAWHHVMNRGARKQPIFAKYNDAIAFLDLLGEMADRYTVEVHAYALMDNHYHLMLRTPQANLSRAMRFLGVRYTQTINRKYQWDGPIFKGRFHSQHIGDGTYLDNVLHYIHLNPVRAAIVDKPEDSNVSSYRAYLDLDPRPKWLSTDVMLERTGGRKGLHDATVALMGYEESWLEGFDPETGWLHPRYLSPVPGETPNTQLKATQFRGTDDVLRSIAALVGCERVDLLQPKRGRGANRERRFAVWALTVATNLTQSEIANHLKCTPGSVSVALHRVRKDALNDSQLQEWMQQWPPG